MTAWARSLLGRFGSRSNERSETSRTERVGRSSPSLLGRRISLDLIAVAAGTLLTYLIMVRFSLGRLLWEDEVLGWMLVRDPSWKHMFSSWISGADGGGCAFYLTGRLWLMAFGQSVTSFRAYSATGFALAFLLAWWSARRFYSVSVVAFAACVTWFISPELVGHFGEGRFYGLFVASTALVVSLIIKSAKEPYPTKTFVVGFFLANSLLVTSHILGVCYSALLLVGLIAMDRAKRNSRGRLYFAVCASWLWLIPSAPAILASAAVGKPYFWTARPTLSSLLFAYTGFSLRTAVIGLFLILLTVVLWRHRDLRVARAEMKDRQAILFVTGALFLIPPLFAIESMVGPSVFNGRYMQPVVIATMFAMCEVAGQLSEVHARWLKQGVLRWIAAIGLVGMVLQYDLAYLPRYSSTHIDYSRLLISHLPRRIPILCEDAFTFTELIARQADSSVQFMYLLDWQYSISPSAPRLEVTQYHLMENWKRVGYFADRVMYRSGFLSAHPFFIVLHTNEDDLATLSRKARPGFRDSFIGDPLTARFARNPLYLTLPFGSQVIGPLRESEALVCRRDLDCTAILKQLKQSVVSP